MTIDREILAAYADGELDADARAQVDAAVAADPSLIAEIEAHRALRARLSAHFAPLLDAPLPERLTAAVRPRAAVVDFAEARRRRETARARIPRWSWIAGPALAASLALALFVPRGDGADYAGDELAQALDRQLVATQPSDAPTRILLSFRDSGGALCRGFSGRETAGIACRDPRGWRLREVTGGGGEPAASGEFRQAGSGDAAVLAAAQEMAAGGALDARQEQAARDSGWIDR